MRELPIVLTLGLIALSCSGDPIPTQLHRPVFSPDGERVVFMRQDASTAGDWELYLAHADGSGVRRLTRHAGWDGYAVFSPDGEQLTFDRDDGDGTPKAAVLMQLATGEVRGLGAFEGRLAVNAWAPDQARLYAFWERQGQRDLYAVTLDGEVVEQITSTADLSEHEVQVTPDGASLVFAAERVAGGGSTIDRIHLASGERETLVTSTGRIYGLALSADGGSLAFTDDTPGGEEDDAELYLLELESGERRQLTDNGDWDHMPVFHPDGKSLLFTSYRSGTEGIYRLTLDDGSVCAFRPQD